MTRALTTIFIVIMLSGCAHKELKAPCANVASLSAGEVPCDQSEPINRRYVPSTFAK